MVEEWKATLAEVLGPKGYIRGPFGSALKRGELLPHGVPVYEQQHAIYGSREFRFFVDEKKYRELSRFTVQANDLIISCSGTLGRVSIIRDEDPIGIISQALLILRPDKTRIDPKYLYYVLSSPTGFHSMVSVSSGSVQVNIAKRSIVEGIEIHLPPLCDQKAIISILGALDDMIDLNRRLNETLEATARAIFRDWLVDFGPTRAKMEGRAPYLSPEIWGLFPDLLDNEGKPQGWQFDRLGAFTDLQNGYAFRSADWMAEGVPVVKIGSVKPAAVDLTEVSYISPVLARNRTAFRLNVGDILVGLTGYVGETGRVPPTISLPMLNQRVGRFSTSGKFSPFVYACVRDPDFKTYAEGKAHGSAQANVSTRDLLDYPVINPGVRVFRAFEDLVRPILDRGLANLGEIAGLAATRDLLLPKLISGEIRVKDAERIAGAAK